MSGPIDIGDEFNDLPELEGDVQQLSDNMTSSDGQEEPEGSQPHQHDIVPQHSDGDVILECKDKVSFLVSSAVLRLTSKYFRTLLEGKFKEGQVPRSTTSPQRIELQEMDSFPLRRLLCLLHHQPEPDMIQDLIHIAENKDHHKIEDAARRFQDLAETIDYFDCSKSLGRVIDSLFSDFATSESRDVMTFTATVHMVSAAYILDNSRYFRLFTKRLLTDYTERFEDAPFASRLPDVVPQLKEISRQSWYRLQIVVNELSQCQCKAASVMCLSGGKDRLIVGKLTDCLLAPRTAWPVRREDGITLRHMLAGLYDLERMQRIAWCKQHEQQIHDTVGPNEFRQHCQAIDRTDVLGLCLTCTKRLRGRTGPCKCSDDNEVRSKEWVVGDSFRFGTGGTKSVRQKGSDAHRSQGMNVTETSQ